MVYSSSPGPAQYQLPTAVGYKEHNKTKWINPAYSMGLFLPKRDDTIGPGPKYQIRDHTRYGHPNPPAYTIKSVRRPHFGIPTPGPGAHSPEKYVNKYRKVRPPAYSMGLTLPSDRDRVQIGPGAAGYNLRKKFPPGPAYSMGITLKGKMIERSPGPAAYDVRPKIERIKPRTQTVKLTNRPPAIFGRSTIGPGPSAYKYYNLPGKKGPAYSFGLKHLERSQPCITAEDNACTFTKADLILPAKNNLCCA